MSHCNSEQVTVTFLLSNASTFSLNIHLQTAIQPNAYGAGIMDKLKRFQGFVWFWHAASLLQSLGPMLSAWCLFEKWFLVTWDHSSEREPGYFVERKTLLEFIHEWTSCWPCSCLCNLGIGGRPFLADYFYWCCRPLLWVLRLLILSSMRRFLERFDRLSLYDHSM